MSEQKQKIGFTVACVDEFARQHNLSAREAFRYLFQFKGIAFIKENYDVEHTRQRKWPKEYLKFMAAILW